MGTSVVKTTGNDTPTKLVYILYLLGPILVFTTSIVGVIIAYLYVGEAKNGYLESHYRFQIRTFWYSIILCVIGTVLKYVLIGFPILLFTLIWYIVRNVRGLRDLHAGRPIPDPLSFLGFGG